MPEHFTQHLARSEGKSRVWEALSHSSVTLAAQIMPSRKGCNSLQHLHQANALIGGKRQPFACMLGCISPPLADQLREHAGLGFLGFPVSQHSCCV